MKTFIPFATMLAFLLTGVIAQAQQQFTVTFINKTNSNVAIRTTYIGQAKATELGVLTPGNSTPIQSWKGQIFEYFTNNKKIGGYQVKAGLGQQVLITPPTSVQQSTLPSGTSGGNFFPANPSGGVSTSVLPAAADKPINFRTVDINVINQAILVATNRERAKNGLPPFVMSPQLVKAAQTHAEDMVNGNFFSHTNPTNPQRKFVAQRVAATGYSNARSVAENIGQGFGIQYTANTQVQFGGSGVFLDARGKQIPAQTPNTLAAALVGQWMASPKHRANILSANTNFGCGLQAYTDPAFNDMITIKAVQVFGLP